MKTETRQIQVERWSVTSFRPFDEIVTAFDAAIGHPEVRTFFRETSAAGSPAELEAIVNKALGPSGFMEFMRFDLGGIVAKESNDTTRIYRFVIGNPLVMKQMVKHVSDAASYAPVTILIAERGDSVRLSYDRMASLIAPYGNAEASKVARDLDIKVESLLIEIAR
jgi:uncharacterized protein (DUF302 family)